MYDPGSQPMHQCPSCGRQFNGTAYPKHVKVCEKVFVAKRKAFNSQAARVEGTEAAKYVAPKRGARGRTAAAAPARKAPPAARAAGGFDR